MSDSPPRFSDSAPTPADPSAQVRPKKKIPRWLLVTAALLLVTLSIAGGILALTAWKVGQVGSTAVEAWAGRWLKARIEENLNLRLHIDDLDYQYPLTLMVHGLRIEADDSRTAGATLDLLVAQQAELTLAQIPETGQPLLIERMIVQSPEVRLIEDPVGFGYLGFNALTPEVAIPGQTHLTEDGQSPLGENATPSTPETNNAEASADAQTDGGKKSRVYADDDLPSLMNGELVPADVTSATTLPIQLRRLEMIDGYVEYQRAFPGAEPILLDGIQIASDLLPEGDDRYAYTIGIERAPELVVQHAGTIDVHNLLLDVSQLAIRLKLDGAGDQSLPMAVRRLLQQKRVRGDYRFDIAGRVPLGDPLASDLQLTAEFDDCFLRHAGWTYPVKSLRYTGGLRDHTVQIAPLKLQALEGEIQVTGDLQLNDYYNADLKLGVRGVEVGMFAADDSGATRQDYLGKLDADIDWNGSLSYYHVDSNGGGNLRFYEARLADIPFLTELGDIIGGRGDGGKLGRDEVTAQFKLLRTHAYLDPFTASSGVVGVFGTGRVYFDQRMNLLFRAGPLEWLIKIMGGSEDSRFFQLLTQYRLWGTFSDWDYRIVDKDARLDE